MPIRWRRVRTDFLVPLAFAILIAAPTQASCQSGNDPGHQVMIRVLGSVRPILRMELDFAAHGSVLILGTIGDEEPHNHRPGSLDLSGSGVATLGSARIFGNLPGYCTVSVYSENGGRLVGGVPGNTTVFHYSLILGDTPHDLSSGTVNYFRPGSTDREGAVLPVSIAYRGLEGRDAPPVADRYTDSIVFSLASN